MKVAVLIDTWFPFIGGGQVNVFEISKRLAKNDVQIDIITRNMGKDNLVRIKNLKVIKLGSKTSPFNIFSKIFFILRSSVFLYSKNYDLIHAHAFLPGITAKLILVFRGTPAVLTVHGTSIKTKLNNHFFRGLERVLLTKIRYSAQITVSRDFLKLKNVNKKVTYIPNGVNINDYDKVITSKFRNPTLIYVGRLHPQKNLIKLIQAFNLAKRSINELSLIIVGDGEEKTKIIELIKNLNLGNEVKLTGELSGIELIKMYKSSHLFLLPSIYEGQPITLLEAWSAKLPVIVSKTGDCGYLVKNGQNGYLIHDVNSDREIAKKIKTAFLNKNLSKLGESGYRLVEKNFSWQNAAKKTFNLYQDLANG